MPSWLGKSASSIYTLSLPCTHENSALRAISFATGRVVSGNSGNWMILADAGVSGSDCAGASCKTLPRRSRLERSSGSEIPANSDKSSWSVISFLYVGCCFCSGSHLALAHSVCLSLTISRSVNVLYGYLERMPHLPHHTVKNSHFHKFTLPQI